MAYLFCRWIQIAKKIISKSKKESDHRGMYVQQRQSSCPPVNRNQGFPTFATNNRHQNNVFPASGRTFNGSENDLSLNYNTINTMTGSAMYAPGGNIRYQPDGRASPEVQMYKTRVIYHPRQEADARAAEHEASV